MTPPLVASAEASGLCGGVSGPSTQDAASPPVGGCELWPFVSVSGSFPPIAVDEHHTDDGEDREEDLHGQFPSLLLELTVKSVSSSACPHHTREV